MSELDPETFEEEKYREQFPQLQTAYKRAFDQMNETYDSELVHAIDQQILNESEPHLNEDRTIEIELPAEPLERVQGVVSDPERLEALLETYVDELVSQHHDVFDLEGPTE